MSKELESRKSGRSAEVGFLLASAAVPRSFQKSLLPRDTTDQGIITGLNMIMAYAIGSIIQDGVDSTADKIHKATAAKGISLKQDDWSFLTSVAVFGLGLGIQKVFDQKDDEKLTRASARTAGYWLSAVGTSGVIAVSLEKSALKVSGTSQDKEAARRRRFLLPLVVPIGALISITRDHIMYHKDAAVHEQKEEVSAVKSAGIALLVASVIGILSAGERKASHAIDNLAKKRAPYLENSWLSIGRFASFGAIGLALYGSVKELYKRTENDADKMEDNFKDVPTNKYVSGNAHSLVSWESLTLQGRRHIDARLSKSQISKVMQSSSFKTREPIRIFVGIESAPTEIARVTLALDELKRTGAFNRENLVIISPTGTGYVNYVFSESVEYMSNGNCASVALQYSKRPSPMSLDRVPEGRDQLRMLIMGINRELKKRPSSKRPRLLLFGESLGAWTSQEAFVGGGTDMMEAYNISRAFWIGTPAGSKWAKQVIAGNRYDTIANQVGVFNDFGKYLKLSSMQKKSLRYVMCTHDDDPIPKFGVSLLVQAPNWLKRGTERALTIPKSTHYRTPLTFIQTMLDMKNALKPIPGEFVAVGHDYRADIADFVRAVFNFDITEKQMTSINAALREADVIRGKTQG